MPDVTILLYKHRHGEDISVYATAELARSAAVDIVRDTLDEIEPIARAKLANMIADAGNPVTDEEIIGAWQEAQLESGDPEHIEISENVTVQDGPEPADPMPEPKCPKCTSTALDDFEVRETYSAYHPVSGLMNGNLFVRNALTVTCPSEQFDEGKGDLVVVCRSCTHEGSVAEFGFPPSDEWEWV